MSNVDTFRRQWLIINLLRSRARYLKSAVSTQQIYDYLCKHDLQVSQRMVQRDMLILLQAVKCVKRRQGNPAGWTFEEPNDEGKDEG